LVLGRLRRGYARGVPNPSRSRTIFLSHAHADSAQADRISDELCRTGVGVRRIERAAPSGKRATEALDAVLDACDVIVILLSPRYLASRWASEELERSIASSMANRAISVVPTLIDECDVPSALRYMNVLDLRESRGMHELAERLRGVRTIDFDRIKPSEFERLVGSLLSRMGFETVGEPGVTDRGWDFLARYPIVGPFGTTIETWAVEVKSYRHDRRVGVSHLHEALGRLERSSLDKCLLVTSGQVTSIARSFIADANRGRGERMRLMEGAELTSRLLEHPDMVHEFFGTPE
jgi:hypothetical protein